VNCFSEENQQEGFLRMPRIYVNFPGLERIGIECGTAASKVDELRYNIQNIHRQLDWDIRCKSDISNTARYIERKLERYARALKAYQRFIEESHKKYIELNTNKAELSLLESCQSFIIEKFDWLFQKVDENGGSLSLLQALLGGGKTLENNDEAGILEKVISYVEDFASFFNGDKAGLTGAIDLCDLTTSSIGLWKEGYDYFQGMFEGVSTGFFGKLAQRNVMIAGLASNILGFASTLMTANNGADGKSWQSIVADYVESGKDLFSIISSGYSLKHIGNVNSLTKIKAGPWSAMDVYTAIAKAGIQTVSQGFESAGNYFADGQWDSADTGATAIDVAMAGLYAIPHALTGGLDDVVFGWVDKAAGGDGNPEMSYYEMAAEGYKILGEKVGHAIGKWWISLTT
jgi:hypothetical protein